MADFDIRFLSPTIGAEIRGVDCSGELADDMVAAIRSVWLERLVVFFPDQSMNDNAQVRFAQRFGEVTEGHPVEELVTERGEIHSIDSLKDRANFWHTDITFMKRPAMAAMLRAVVVPDSGGDTMFCDTRAAYDSLAEPLRRLCDELTAIHYDEYYAKVVEGGGGNVWEGKQLTRLAPAEHPVVRVHPETRRRNLFVNPKFTAMVKDFPRSQGDGLLRILYEHMTQPEFIVRYHWSAGTLGFWDNRATMHFGIYDYGTQRRIMHRITLRGDQPIGPLA